MVEPTPVVEPPPVEPPRRTLRTPPADLGLRDVRPSRAVRQRRLTSWGVAARGSRVLAPR